MTVGWTRGNGDNVIVLAHEGSAVNADPDFTDAPNQDFTVGSGSPVLDTGIQVGTDTGAVGDYKWNIGTDQDDNAAGGGTSFFTFN